MKLKRHKPSSVMSAQLKTLLSDPDSGSIISAWSGKETMKSKAKPECKKRGGSSGAAPCSAAVVAQLAAFKARGCFRCDGTKRICNICGESGAACDCEEENFNECPDCKPPNDQALRPARNSEKDQQ